MGYWNITINGMGNHHNNGSPNDADVLFNRFVEDLRKAGQTIDYAGMTHGGRVFDPHDLYTSKKT